jgi:hypothetical protein
MRHRTWQFPCLLNRCVEPHTHRITRSTKHLMSDAESVCFDRESFEWRARERERHVIPFVAAEKRGEMGKKFQRRGINALAAFQMNYVCEALRSFAFSFCSAISLRSLQTAFLEGKHARARICCDSWYTSALLYFAQTERVCESEVSAEIHARWKKLFFPQTSEIKAWSVFTFYRHSVCIFGTSPAQKSISIIHMKFSNGRVVGAEQSNQLITAEQRDLWAPGQKQLQ